MFICPRDSCLILFGVFLSKTADSGALEFSRTERHRMDVVPVGCRQRSGLAPGVSQPRSDSNPAGCFKSGLVSAGCSSFSCSEVVNFARKLVRGSHANYLLC